MNGMATENVLDIAAFMLKEKSPITTMKLQKLLYYCQAWSLVWDGKPLFKEPIEAWANGPVVRKLYDIHKGKYEIEFSFMQEYGNPDNLADFQKETVKAVLHYYGNKSPQWLIDITHMENPWREARNGLADRERGHEEIHLASLAEYYEKVYNEGIEIRA